MKKLSLVLVLVLFAASWMLAQRTISGVVTDGGNGDPLIGANVIIKGTTTGTVCDVNGAYSLSVPEGANTLVFSYIGYNPTEVELTGSNTLDVTLSEGVLLESVTVNALGLKQNKDKTGSASSTVRGEAMVKSGETGILQGLAGKSSSVVVTRTGGDPGAGAYIQIRGQNTITGNTQPLIVIDGMPVFNSSFGSNRVATGNQTDGVVQQSRLNDINPDDIESMEILKGAAAAALWGTRAANGVVVITTKKGASGNGKKFDVNFRSTISTDQVNVEHPLQSTWGQGSNGNWVAGTGNTWGDKIADRSGAANQEADAPGKYFDADGVDMYNGFFEAEGGTKYYNVVPANTDVFDASGNLLFTTGASGGNNSKTVHQDGNRDQVFRNGFFTDNAISIGTGDASSNFLVSYSNLSQKGIIKGNSDYKRNTLRINSSQRFTDYLKLSMNASYANINSNRIQTGSNLSGLYLGYLRTSPDFDNTDYKGTYVSASGVPNLNRQRGYRNHLGTSSPAYNNPGWTINEQINTSSVNRYMFAPELSFDPTTWLNITGRVGIDNYADTRQTFFPVWSAGSGTSGANDEEIYQETQINTDIFARASHSFSSKVVANVLVGFNLNDRKFRYNRGFNSNFVIPGAPSTTLDNAAADNTGISNFKRDIRSNAGYVTVGMDLWNMLNVDLTARTEVASTFTDNIFYPSASAAWRFTQLDGLKQNSTLSFGKLRASYGTVGVQPQPYLTGTDYVGGLIQESWGPNLNADLYGGSFVQSTVQGNPNLQPEKKTEFEIGADLRFIKNRIGLSATYYANTIEGAIFAVDVPASTGFASKWDNAATIENKGFEIDVDADIIKNKDFTWNLFGNWSTNENLVVDLQGVESIFLNGFTGSSSRAVEGQPMGTFWGGLWDRNDAGELILDENGFPQQALEEGIMGDPNPDWRGSLGTGISYKGFTVSALFETMQGNQMWGGTRGVLTYFGRHPDTEGEVTATEDLPTVNGGTIAAGETFRGEVRDFGDGNVALTQAWYQGLGGGFGPVGEQFIYDASWTRLRELSLSYRLSTKGFMEKSKLDYIEIGVTGRNLLLITDFEGQDPDMNLTGASNGRGLDYFSNPGTKSFLFTIKINY